MASLNANTKYFNDSSRAGSENWVGIHDIRSAGNIERMQMREVMRLVLVKVMKENNLDVLVNPENTLPHPKIGGPRQPSANRRSASGATQTLTALLGIPEIVVPAGFNQIVYEPQFALNAATDNYSQVAGTEQSLLETPLPISMMFWAGPGEESTVLKVASAYEAATKHRKPPPDFGPLAGEP